MGSYNYYNQYNNQQQNTDLTKNMNEIDNITCPSCKKKMLRVFTPANSISSLKYKNNIKEYLYALRKRMNKYNKNKQNEYFISGPKYTLLFDEHNNMKQLNQIDHGYSYKMYCKQRILIADTCFDLVSMLMLDSDLITKACIINHINQKEILQWLRSLNDLQMIQLFDGVFKIKEMTNLNMWYAMYDSGIIKTTNINYLLVDKINKEWLGVSNSIFNMKENFSNLRKNVYGKSSYAPMLGVNLPPTIRFSELSTHSWGSLVDVELEDGTKAKASVSYDRTNIPTGNNFINNLVNCNVPNKFWMIQTESIKNTSPFKTGDIVI